MRKAIALAGGLTERASENKIYVIREKDIQKNKINVTLDDVIFPGDVITINEGFF